MSYRKGALSWGMFSLSSDKPEGREAGKAPKVPNSVDWCRHPEMLNCKCDPVKFTIVFKTKIGPTPNRLEFATTTQPQQTELQPVQFKYNFFREYIQTFMLK